MSSGKITMDDIVNMAGVTRSTVFRYSDGGSVRESTRERMQEIIREHNCKPNAFARPKAKGSNAIGVVLSTLNSGVSSRVMTSIGRYLRGQEYEMLIKNSDHNADLGLENIQRLITLKVDGTILSAITITEVHRKLTQGGPVPVVVLAQGYDRGISTVRDDYGAGEVMGVRVAKARPVRVGHMGVSILDAVVGINRKWGMMDGLKEWGIKDVIAAAGDHSYVNGTRMAGEMMDQGPVDATTCAADCLAFGVYHVLGERGLRIPEDASMAGFDGHDENILLGPDLITLRPGSYSLGYLGAEAILKMIHREPVPKKQIVGYTIIEDHSIKEQSGF